MGSTVDVLRLLAAFSNETSYTVWESLVSTLSTFNRLFSYTEFYDSFKAYAIEMFKPSLTRLGWESKDTDGEAASCSLKYCGYIFSLNFKISRTSSLSNELL